MPNRSTASGPVPNRSAYGSPQVPVNPGASGGRPPGGGDARPAAAQPGRESVEEGWRTEADDGWRRASDAAEPAPAGITRSGLPKRVPQAQLVPGGVKPKSGNERSRRTPDEVRGLLSAYHRGVQRGRTAGEAEAGSSTESYPKETNG